MAKSSETTHQRGGHSTWRQFWVLLWKNWLLQKKMMQMIDTVFLFLLPILWSLYLIFFRSIYPHTFNSNATTYDSFFVAPNFNGDRRFPPEKLVLAYAPNTTLIARIVNRATTIMGVKNPTNLGFVSESKLEDYVAIHPDTFGSIVFLDSEYLVGLPTKISYKIRLRSDEVDWKTDAMFYHRITLKPRNVKDRFGGNDPGYYRSGFLAIQNAVDLSLITEVNQSFDPTTMNVTTQLKRYPYPPYRADEFISVMKFRLPLHIVIASYAFAYTICQEIVLEKENKFKESMKLMGMRMWLYWSSWFVKYLLLMLISVIIMTIILHASISRNGPVIAYSSPTFTFVFLILYSISIITFCFVVSTLFSKATYCMIIGCILFFLSYTPFFYLERIYDDMSLVHKLAASVDFNLALGFGCIKISQQEELGIGSQWSNLWSQSYAGDDLTMGHILIMLLVDTVLHLMLTWYLDAVIPGEFGSPQPLNFPFTREYWMGRKGDELRQSSDDFMTLVPEDRRPYFETPLQNAKAGIQIRGLTKV